MLTRRFAFASLLLLVVLLLPATAWARMGGGESFGGSSSSGSSSSSSSSAARGGSFDSLTKTQQVLLLSAPALAVLLFIGVAIQGVRGERREAAKKWARLDAYRAADPGFDAAAIIERTKQTFLLCQEAWFRVISRPFARLCRTRRSSG